MLHVPHRHRDLSIVPLSELEIGAKGTLHVEVLGNTPRPFRRKGFSITSVKVGDDSGTIRASWFNQPWIAQKLQPGARLLLTGSRDKRGFRVSEYEILEAQREGEDGGAHSGAGFFASGGDGSADKVGEAKNRTPPPTGHPHPPRDTSLVPVHPATEKLKAQKIRGWAEQAVKWAPNVIEGLPAELRARRELAGAGDAISAVHFPESEGTSRGLGSG